VALIYNTGWGGVADIRVFDVGSQGLADLLVWQTQDQAGLPPHAFGSWTRAAAPIC